MTQDELISEIEQFAAAHGIAPATVTSRSVNNSRLYQRMKMGAGCTMKIAEKLRAYMAANPPPSAPTTSQEEAA